MGIDIGSKLMVGLPYKYLLECKEKEMTEESYEDWLDTLENLLDDGVVDYASPHYDSERKYWFIGMEVGGGNIGDTILKILYAERDFLALFNLNPEVFSLPDVT